MSIVYAEEPGLSVADYVAVFGESSMRLKRPLANEERIAEMLAGANFIVTARRDDELLGVARCITDRAWICYCADLAVRESAQGLGVGRGILETCWTLLGPRVGFILVSEPDAIGFYERVGMSRDLTAFYRTRSDRG